MAQAKGKKGQSTATTVMEVGAGVLAAAAAAGAGYYFYGDKNAKKHRAAASKWTKDMKNDVLKEAKKLKKLDQKAIATIVDRASAAYSTVRSIDKNDLKSAATELKRNWKEVQREITSAGKSASKSVKKTASSATKSVKKAVKKATSPAKKSVKKTVKKAVKKATKKGKK
ncbi:MAG: hypothetical protein JWN90_295 [Parcubacteria group bacterium]|nr:hypothetical protein [Parcubacteria group bacterium]